MKDYISYYYHLIVEELRLIKGKYFFHNQQHYYLLEPVSFSMDSLDEIHQFQEFLHSESSFYHQIIKNVQGNIVSMIDQKAYVLLRLSNVLNEKISIYDLRVPWSIVIPQNKRFLNTPFPWFQLWEAKIDYFEDFSLRENKSFSGNPVIFDYFIGMGENAISYLKESLKELPSFDDLPFVPSHRRVFTEMSLIDFYDPLSIILDVRVRDIAEYVKECFWNKNYDFREIEDFLNQANFSKIEFQLFFARVLFPSFYFDCLEKKEIPKEFMVRLEEYQFFITDIYYYLRERYFIEEIKWLKKKT